MRTMTSAPLVRAASSNRRRVSSRVVSTAHNTTTVPPPRTASRARALSTRNIGTDALAAASAAGPNVEHVRRTASASVHSACSASTVCCVIADVSVPARSAAASNSGRTQWRSVTPARPSSRLAVSNTDTLLSAVCRQAMRGRCNPFAVLLVQTWASRAPCSVSHCSILRRAARIAPTRGPVNSRLMARESLG